MVRVGVKGGRKKEVCRTREGVAKLGVGGIILARAEVRKKVGTPVVGNTTQDNSNQQYIFGFKSRLEDKTWASSMMVATVSVGDSALALQQRIEDAGFIQVVVIPMGGLSLPSL